MKFLIDIELSGLIAVEADSVKESIRIAERVGTDKLKDSLLNCNTELVGELTQEEEKDFACFSEKDI